MNKYMSTNWTIWVKWTNSWKHNVPSLNQKESETLNREITTSVIEAVKQQQQQQQQQKHSQQIKVLD